jgi:hypothetical protein
MPDTDDYADTPPPNPAAADRPEDFRLADRVQLTGWLGIFIGIALGGAALIYGLAGKSDVAAWVIGLGAPAVVYAAAGGYLVAIGFLERPPRGERVFMANLLIVVPVLGVATITLLSPVATIVLLCLNPSAITCSQVAAVPFLVFNYTLLGTAAVKKRRRVIARLRAWLDPTAA